jgi:hypothetical protein
MLELNNSFSNTSKHYGEQGDDEDRDYLQRLIESIRSHARSGYQVPGEPPGPREPIAGR